MEGLPLQLLIIVIIAAVAIAVVLGWMYLVQDPQMVKTVTATPSLVKATGGGPYTNASFNVTVKAWDQDDSPLAGAVVELSGGGLVGGKAVGKTDSSGTCVFNSLGVELGSDQTTQITVKVSKADYESGETEILVVCTQ